MAVTYIAKSIEDVAQFWDKAASVAHQRQNRAATKKAIWEAEIEERCYREFAHHLRHVKFESVNSEGQAAE